MARAILPEKKVPFGTDLPPVVLLASEIHNRGNNVSDLARLTLLLDPAAEKHFE